MKVVLLKDVAKVGKKYDIKDVSDGHALNFLIPKGVALTATDALIKKVEKEKKQASLHTEKAEASLMASLEALKGKGVSLTLKANDKGHLFESVNKTHIAELLAKGGAHVDVHSVNLEKPLKEIGDHPVHIKVGEKVVIITVKIKAA